GGGTGGGGGGGGGITAIAAHGLAFNNGKVLQAFAQGGIVNTPTIFPLARGAGLMGEAGPEAILPLTRTRGGDLGVNAEGMGGGLVVNITNNTDADVNVNQGNDGESLDVTIDNIMAQKIVNGRTGTALRKNYGVGPGRAGR
ncbi:hypothetical protein LCGC14_1443910, partial [marine sediment metagenome]